MRTTVIKSAIGLLILSCLIPVTASAYVINSFGPSAYLGGSSSQLAHMRNNLGINGAVIEDFTDTNLVPGLSLSGPPYGGFGNTFPNTWGSPNSNSFIAYPTATTPAFINIASGVAMIGIGIGYMEFYGFSPDGVYSTVTINNSVTIDFTPQNFPLFDFGVLPRNGYITITAEPSDSLITSLEFRTLGSYPSPGDAYTFDYIALKKHGVHAVPEPGSLLLLGMGLGGIAIFRTRLSR